MYRTEPMAVTATATVVAAVQVVGATMVATAAYQLKITTTVVTVERMVQILLWGKT